MTCTTCKISAAPFELRDGKCINCLYSELLEARKDAARLDWLEASGNRSVGRFDAGTILWLASDYDRHPSKDGEGSTARQAIDAAMKAEKEQE